MARGGYRPGAGRKKGTKSKDKVFDSEEKARIEEMLSHGMKAKAKIYSDYLNRVKNGEKVSLTEKRLMDKVESELKASVSDNTNKQPTETPLEYMLRVMNDLDEDKEMRCRMAIAAAPYLHKKADENLGKKGEQDEKAKRAASGRFKQAKAPLSVVK